MSKRQWLAHGLMLTVCAAVGAACAWVVVWGYRVEHALDGDDREGQQ